LSLVIGSTVLKEDALAIPGALYGVLMYAGGLVYALAMRRLTTPPQV
jgi:BASS family bile acid:Na+ symporter